MMYMVPATTIGAASWPRSTPVENVVASVSVGALSVVMSARVL
jgi:hypothetical protein